MRRGVNLKAKLDAYEASSAVGSGAAAKKRHRTWPVYAAAGSGLAMATSAEAGIVYSGPLNLTASIPDATSFVARSSARFPMKGANFGATVSGGAGSGRRGARAALGSLRFSAQSRALVAVNGSGQLKQLAFGAKISSNAGSFSAPGPGHGFLFAKRTGPATNYMAGTWKAGKEGFVGVELIKSQGSGTYFGWIRLRFDANSAGFPRQVTVIDWAYNTVPGQGITAGELSAVPEPNSMVLALLGTGYVGVVAWRKRKAQSPTVTEARDGAEALN
jgi:PEP-CTERM motif